MCPDTDPNAARDEQHPSDPDPDPDPDTEDGPTRTLSVRVGDADELHREARERVRAAERGEDLDERHVLNFEDEADLARLVSETNLELLRAIANRDPESMRQVEEIVGRDHKEVHRNLRELEALGVVELVESGRSKRPVVRFDELEITVPIRRDETREVSVEDATVADETENSEGRHSEV